MPGFEPHTEISDAEEPETHKLVIGDCPTCGRPAIGIKQYNETRYVCLNYEGIQQLKAAIPR